MGAEKTLLEQMRISDVDILGRMDVLDLCKEDLDILRSHLSLIEDNIDIIVEEFYAKQLANDEIALLIGDDDTLHRLHSAQRGYVLDLFSGQCNGAYVNNRLRIGMVHKYIGVPPKLYLSSMRSLKEIIVVVLMRSIKAADILETTLQALDKLIYFDITLVFDAYIDSLVGEIHIDVKRKIERYALNLEKKVQERTRRLEEQAKTDPLTGVYNQRVMQEMLRRELIRCYRHQTNLSLVYFDLDDFKAINDKLGHLKGDEVLKYIGKTLLHVVREIDIACRYGGDEFCLILPDCSLKDAKIICQRIIEKFNEKYPNFSISMGVATPPLDNRIEADELIKEADEKMYLAKKHEGSYVQI